MKKKFIIFLVMFFSFFVVNTKSVFAVVTEPTSYKIIFEKNEKVMTKDDLNFILYEIDYYYKNKGYSNNTSSYNFVITKTANGYDYVVLDNSFLNFSYYSDTNNFKFSVTTLKVFHFDNDFKLLNLDEPGRNFVYSLCSFSKLELSATNTIRILNYIMHTDTAFKLIMPSDFRLIVGNQTYSDTSNFYLPTSYDANSYESFRGFVFNTSEVKTVKIHYDLLEIYDKLTFDLSATKVVSAPVRFSLLDKKTEYIKEPNDFTGTALKFYKKIRTLGYKSGVKSGYFLIDLRSADPNTIVTLKLYFSNLGISFRGIDEERNENLFAEVDITNYLGVGLIPKDVNSPFLNYLYLKGNFYTYKTFNNNTFNNFDGKIIDSVDSYSKEPIDFTKYRGYSQPVYYVFNNLLNYKASSFIKYDTSRYDIIYFTDKSLPVINNNFTYSPPSNAGYTPPFEVTDKDFLCKNFNIGCDSSGGTGTGGLNFLDMVSAIPSLLGGFVNTFGVIGNMFTVFFATMPPLLTQGLSFAFFITLVGFAIKFIRG